jgi:hypothetical protein
VKAVKKDGVKWSKNNEEASKNELVAGPNASSRSRDVWYLSLFILLRPYAVFAILIWKVQAGREEVSATTTLAMPKLERMPRRIPHGNHRYYIATIE